MALGIVTVAACTRRAASNTVSSNAVYASAPRVLPRDAAPEASRSSSGARASLLQCELDVQVVRFEPGAGPPGAPVVVGDAFALVYARMVAGSRRETRTMLARVDVGRTLGAEQLLDANDRGWNAPYVVVNSALYLPVYAPRAPGSAAVLAAFDLPSGVARADAPAPSLGGSPRELAVGPRGIVAVLSRDRIDRVLVRGVDTTRLADVPLPPQSVALDPPEVHLASGPDADALLMHRTVDATHTALDLHVVAAGASRSVQTELARSEATPVDASIAAGPDGFLVAMRRAPTNDLELVRLDRQGNIQPGRVTLSRPEGVPVLAYPRIASLGAGWALTAWDGTGALLFRLDASGARLGASTALRSGDERGGHTDARITVAPSGDRLAVSWNVTPPLYGHGSPGEEPEHPGPRLAVLRCRP